MKNIILLLIITMSSKAMAFEERWFLKGGVGTGLTYLKALNNQDWFSPSIGFSTHFGYRFKIWEISLSSYVNIAKYRKLQFTINNSQLSPRGLFRSVSFGPTFKRMTNKPLFKHWLPYVALTPLLALQTFKIESVANSENDLETGKKLTYDSYGGAISFGVEEILPKINRPTYIELTYKFLTSRRRSKIGGTTAEQITLLSEPDSNSVKEHSLKITLGILIF